ncbi:MAG: phosphoenolpyruvate carboxykinase (ATP) [Tindallia sp. MSAO_Bac2]|nr:MAG: phosphoenolpyruvate carboxykinase (ATP) [Tindallia sp. MSAO_Bac2]
MSTINRFKGKDEFDAIKSQIRTTIQTAFYQNNVQSVKTVAQAYQLAKKSPGTIPLTGIPIYEPEKQGLPEDAHALLFNDGNTFGRAAAARRISGDPGVNLAEYSAIIRDAIYDTRKKSMYHGEVIIGLHRNFMIKAHILIPENHENIFYSWLLNFQYVNEVYSEMYKYSKKIPEGDIVIFCDPDWSHPDHPMGLTFFDPTHNCAAILGMKYFGEYKKGTLTLAWGTAARNGFAACHGGLKCYNLPGKRHTIAVFGLSGSGKSTITHAKHDNKYNVTVLHDDAFIINIEDKTSIALEPTYFDKTQDYPMNCEDNKYILTMQNNGAIMYDDGKIYPVTEDLRNGNGRAIKSKLWAADRVDRIDDPINSIFWIMKDPTMPPVVKLKGAALGSVMGATLATKRTSAEKLPEGVNPDQLVVEPYANPFRTYPLSVDYKLFKSLFESGVDCYVINTGHFMGKKVKPQHTLEIIESIIEDRAEFVKWEPFEEMEIMKIDGFDADLEDPEYRKDFMVHFVQRIQYVESRQTVKDGVDALPAEAVKSLYAVMSELHGDEDKKLQEKLLSGVGEIE